MAPSTQTVDHLTKVKLIIRAGTKRKDEDLLSTGIPYEIVVGVGAQGYSPFEYELLDKKVGDHLQLTIEAGKTDEFFEHLPIPSGLAQGDTKPIHLHVKIDRIDIPDQAEIIRAMAEGAACSDHCCGTHA
ncbi:MAG: hypothetical protein U5R49_07875 [Deltaproteobacteria bacterium]|nr:hypothetical protein [Deltaproteobacteria bacterium]